MSKKEGGKIKLNKRKIVWDYWDSCIRFYYDDKTYYVPEYIIEDMKRFGREEYRKALMLFLNKEQ